MNNQTIQLAHGGGGLLSRELIQSEIVPRFGKGPLEGLPDAATLPAITGNIVLTTDSYVVSPLEFPGGNIGCLAVHGSVNDVAVAGGLPRWLTLGLILEEGLPMELLRRILDAVQSAADDCGVSVVTGDTKVVARGECDGLYINTAAVGEAIPEFTLDVGNISAGDLVLVSGQLGDHGLAVLAARDGIGIENGPLSDTAPVHRLVLAAREHGAGVRFMRDPTRGGLAAVLNEMVSDRSVGICIDAASIPVSEGAHAVSEMLGLDPLHVACEGRLVMVCAAESAAGILEQWQAIPEGKNATCIGTVVSSVGSTNAAGMVIMKTVAGGHRLVDVPRGELLPRIC